MTALGLSNTIPEEPSELELSDSVQLQNAGRIASKSAIDLVGLNEDEVFDVTAEGEKAFGAFSNPQQFPTPLDSGFSFQITLLPSRCLMISNLSPLLSDDRLRLLFQNFGEVQFMRTEYKLQGILQVAYYDIRSSAIAKDQLSGVQMSGQCLNVQFVAAPGSVGSFSEGTLLVFNIDPLMDSNQVAASFLPYGEVRRVHPVPEKDDYRVIEFYDIRHSNAAMNALNSAARSKDLSSMESLTRMKQTLSLHNLTMGSNPGPESEEDQSSRSWDESAQATQQMENYIGLEGSMGQGFHAGMTKSMSFGSGLCDQQTTGFEGGLGTTIQSPKSIKGAVQLTPQLAEGLKLSDSASSLGPISPGMTSLANQTKTGVPFSAQHPLNRSNLSYSASVGTGLDSYGNQGPGFGNLLSSVDPQTQNQGLGNLAGLNSAQLLQLLNYTQNNANARGQTG